MPASSSSSSSDAYEMPSSDDDEASNISAPLPKRKSSPSKFSAKASSGHAKLSKQNSVTKKRAKSSLDAIRGTRTKSVPRETSSPTKRAFGLHSKTAPSIISAGGSAFTAKPHLKERLGNRLLLKSSSASNLPSKVARQAQRKSPLANGFGSFGGAGSRRLRTRPSGSPQFGLSIKNETSSSSTEDVSTFKRVKNEPKQSPCRTPFQIEEPIVVGDYSNPYEGLANPNFYQQKMCDAIDLNRYLWLADNLGFCKRPVYRPFLIRNLSYMRATAAARFNADSDNCPIASLNGISTPNDAIASGNGHRSVSPSEHDSKAGIRGHELAVKAELPRVVNRMPSTIKFNFIRNNLCFGDRSAIVQCFHASEINYTFGSLKRIPSATFDMKVNEKLSHISIDLPEDFSSGFMESLDSKSRVEYFIVRVVFRYEDAEVGGGKRLRKVPSRQTMQLLEKTLRSIQRHNLGCNSNESNVNQDQQEVVMFGTKQIVSFSKADGGVSGGLSVVHGETSIVLHSSEDLKISGNLDGKTYDNPFMSIQVQNLQDEDDDEEDEEEDDENFPNGTSPSKHGGKSSSSPTKGSPITENLNITPTPTNMPDSRIVFDDRAHNSSPMTAIPFPAHIQRNPENDNLPEKIALQFVLNTDYQQLTRNPFLGGSRSNASSRESSIQKSLSKDDESMYQQEDDALEARIGPPTTANPDNNWLLRNLNIGSPNSPNNLDGAVEDGAMFQKFKVRVLNSHYMCFFCLAQMSFPSLQSMLFHLRLCHARFKFNFENVTVSKSMKLPGFSVSLNHNFDSSYEMNPSRHYVKLPSEKVVPRKRVVVAPIWIITKNLARTIRKSMLVEGFSEFNSFLLDRDVSFSDGIRHGTRYCFEPPTKINHPWMKQANSRNLSEITDLHPSEQAMMKMWNDFLVEIRITHLGNNMTYKAARVFVDLHRDTITQLDLRIHFLFHLTNLVNVGCVDEEERYDLFMHLDPNYNPRFDNAHLVSKQLELLERERINQGRDRFKNKAGKYRLSQAPSQGGVGGPNIMECLDDLKSMYPFASTRRLEKIWKFMDSYCLEDFRMTIL